MHGWGTRRLGNICIRLSELFSEWQVQSGPVAPSLPSFSSSLPDPPTMLFSDSFNCFRRYKICLLMPLGGILAEMSLAIYVHDLGIY